MSDKREVVKVSVSEAGNNIVDGEYKDVDPRKDFNLGEQAYKVERKDVADTEKSLKGLGMSYFVVRGGEINAKEFNEDKTAVIFNDKLKDRFIVPIKGKGKTYEEISVKDTWYANKSTAYGIAKQLSAAELEKSTEALKLHQKACSFIEEQMENNIF